MRVSRQPEPDWPGPDEPGPGARRAGRSDEQGHKIELVTEELSCEVKS